MIPGLGFLAGSMKRKLAMYQVIRKDPRTPRLPRILLTIAVTYIASPIDLIPDFIPVIGHLDDAVVIPVLVLTALALVPKEVVADARRAVEKR